MINHKLVLSEHLNHYGYLFGGHLLNWVDEYSYITAKFEFPENMFVTIGLDKVVFRKTIKIGSILRFEIDQVKRGNTAVTYNAKVFNQSKDKELVFDTNITFVSIDENGEKTPLRDQ